MNVPRDNSAPQTSQSSLIRVLPACLTEALPAGWEQAPAEYTIEVMPEVERPEAVAISLRTTEPDILLLDADFPDADVFDVTRQALAEREDLAVVIVSRNNAPEQLRRAMLAGVEEYLIKPLDANSLRESLLGIASHRTLRVIEQTVEAAAAPTQGIVIGVVSGKGGLGKTTLASNLAALMAKVTRQPVGLVGFESGDGAVLLSVQPKLGLLDMAASMNNSGATYTPEWLRQFGTTHRNNLMYWTWQGLETQPGAQIPEDFLPGLFETCRQACRYTFVDFPLLSEEEIHSVGPLLDILLVVTSSSDLLALRSTKTFLDTIPEEFRQRVRVIINRADPADMISREDFEEALAFRVAAALPNEPAVAAQAINMGAPFVLTQTQSELSGQVRELARALFKIEITDPAVKSKRRFSLFGN